MRGSTMVPRMKIPRYLPYMLGTLTAVGPISTDLYLPAFHKIEAGFGLPHGAAQITLATWFFGFAVGQMLQGAATDWLGRRTPLLAGTLIYSLASLGCALAPGMGALALGRFLSAIGGAASSVVPRAVVRDHADGHAAARIMAQLALVTGVAPLLAPAVGGFLLTFISWRWLFGFCVFYGLVSSALVYFFLPETLPPHKRHAIHVGAALQRYWGILREPHFASHTFMSSAALFAIFSFVSGSPVMVTAYHISTARMGVLLTCASIPYILSAQLNPRLLAVFGTDRVIGGAVVGTLVASSLAFVGARLWVLPLPVFIGMVMANTMSLGLIMPNAMISALSRHARSAGSASALAGTVNFLAAALCGWLSGIVADGTVRPITGMLLGGSMVLVVAQMVRLRVRRVVAR